ncbi:MAG: LON peptidase substrate-binding domain-containing protein [Anaerolineaceae bacterium]|nr:LON peptidase substrate-binding domain-containing protein [Anaerolineaceae bacterium]
MYDLPLFPLDTVLFPGTPIFLHIFEERYKMMIKHCLETGAPFGVILIRRGVESLGPLAEPYSIGCTARLVTVEKLEEGRMNLVAMGDERFQILKLDRSKSYLIGKVETIPLEKSAPLKITRLLKPLDTLVHRYTSLLKEMGGSEYELGELQLPNDYLAMLYIAAALLQIPAFEKQPLLSAPTVQDLVSRVFRLYRRETVILSSLQTVNEATAVRAAWLN